MASLRLTPIFIAATLLVGCADMTPEQAERMTNALAIMSTWQPQGASRLPPGAYTLGPPMTKQ